MTPKRPLIFISNDDGVNSGGIKFLTQIARSYGEVFVVAPQQAQSGKSSAITIETPLRPQIIQDDDDITIYSVNGTPVDCAKLALNKLLPRTPSLILSGINHGFNAGNSAIYSGTMGVVFEGSFLNIPSIGFSYGNYSADADFSQCEPIIRHVIEGVLKNGLPSDICLNVNIPFCDEIKGIKTTIGAKGRWTEEYEERKDPFGRPYFWITGKYMPSEPHNAMNDVYWLDRGYASITPCHADQTAFDALDTISHFTK